MLPDLTDVPEATDPDLLLFTPDVVAVLDAVVPELLTTGVAELDPDLVVRAADDLRDTPEDDLDMPDAVCLPVLLDLDATLRDQLVIFDNKEDIDISYIGMPNAFVKAPKPQLIRVFVNLLTNAIQAIEIQKKDTGGAEHGKILICLRNSTEEGYYDIVFDDSGPGVSEENQARLFTPNFTTKNGGTGLGLAICRNIVEKCNGEIFYRKSYSLGGASFTVRLPKEKDQYT